jgi:hypothetical protein
VTSWANSELAEVKTEVSGLLLTTSETTQPTSNDYGYAISAVAGLMVVGSVIYMAKKKKVVDDAFCTV